MILLLKSRFETMVNWQWKSSVILVIVFLFLYDSAIAQVIPDDTLGDESSVVNSRDETSDLINGGAIRGQNLFHSFQEFNIGEGREANFANPAEIKNIFSRVTGNNPSTLLGKLGVLGDANLFFINPNGIFFGENASLDVKGSFVASTAGSINFSENNMFSARNPQVPAPLLTVDVPAPVGLEFEGVPGKISSELTRIEVKPEKPLLSLVVISM